MIETETKHTFILTIDKQTMRDLMAGKSPISEETMQRLMSPFERKEMQDVKDGVYFKTTVTG